MVMGIIPNRANTGEKDVAWPPTVQTVTVFSRCRRVVRYGVIGNNVVGCQETYQSDRSYCDVLTQEICYSSPDWQTIIEERGALTC
jgi:hypothetical protein